MAVKVSIVVIAFNMRREIPRTLYSLSPAMQREIDPEAYEVVLVNNGSTEPFVEAEFDCPNLNLRVLHAENPTVSPAPAINMGIKFARGELIGVMIDGARLATPGLVISAFRAARLHPRPVIATLAFHLGGEVQMNSVLHGYDQEVEDKLLGTVDWKGDGYRLFDISVFAGSSAGGWFRPIAESNALFLTRLMWEEMGGCDESFRSPGGGLANLDLYKRACGLPNSQLIMILGEGTFHQFHGGVSTNAKASPMERFSEEYLRLRGQNFAPPNNVPWFFGEVRKHAWPSIRKSVEDSSDKLRTDAVSQEDAELPASAINDSLRGKASAVANASKDEQQRIDLAGGMSDETGRLQFDFMLAQGLTPETKFLEIGCGCFRSGVHFVKFLDAGGYFGFEMHQGLVGAGFERELLRTGLANKLPRRNCVCNASFDFDDFGGVVFDMALAMSVFTRLTLNQIRILLERLTPRMNVGGIFYASFFECPPKGATGDGVYHKLGGVTSYGSMEPYHYRIEDLSHVAKNLPWSLTYIGNWGHPKDLKMISFKRT